MASNWFTRLIGRAPNNYEADVDINGQLAVRPALTVDKAGFVLLAGQINDGSVTGAAENLPLGISEEGRLEVGLDSLIFNDQFNYAAQNSANYREVVATQTITHASGYAVLNGSTITTINTNSAFQTYRSFPIMGGFGLEVGCSALHTSAPQVNAVTEWGLFTATLPGAAIPTDGAYFRFTNAGTFVAVINYNGTETISSALPIPAANVNHAYDILFNEETIVFIVDGVVQYDVDTPTGFGQPFQSASLPFTVRHYIAGSAPALAMQFKISNVDVNLSDMNTTKPWAHTMSAQGLHAYQGQNGGTMGSTALYTNSLAAGAGVAATNTTAALGSGLGGQFALQPTLTVGTDGIISSYQNPAGGVGQAARTILVNGIRIDALVTTALTGGPVYIAWSLAFGHTAVSLATAEAAGAKAPRRIPLGIQTFPVTAPVGTLGQSINVHFDTPVPINPGEFIQTVAKNLGTVTSAGVIVFLISFDAYNE